MLEVKLLSITHNAEKLIEDIGRTCYLSHNRMVRGSERKFIKMIIKRGHYSVLEHACATFRIKGGSRAFTHQFVRHRLCSFAQQSQRYVSEKNFNYIEPEKIRRNKDAHKLFLECMGIIKKVYTKLQKLGISREDARFVLPNSVESEIVITANFREFRHIFNLRGAPNAQWEIRKVVIEMLRILKKYAPTVFEDFVIDEERYTVSSTLTTKEE